MDEDIAEHEPVAAQLLGDKAYVWDVEGIKLLRRQHRLVGSMVGGIAGYNTQVAVHGLPLQLSREEVALAASNGWITLYAQPSPAAGAPASTQPPQAGTPAQAATAAGGQKRKQPEAPAGDRYDDYYGDYYASADGEQAGGQPGDDAAGQQAGQSDMAQPAEQQQHAQAQQQDDPATDDCYAQYYGDEESQEKQQQQPSQPSSSSQPTSSNALQPSWQDAVRHGTHYVIPVTAVEAAEASAERHPAGGLLPALTLDQARRVAIFRDLYRRGFTITSGSKFGGQLMLYPGDPKLYHAQFVVRIMAWDEAICPSLLKAYARGVHAARKHLVLATVQPEALQAALDAGDGWRLGHVPGSAFLYTTFARESGFVSTKVA